MKVSGIPDDAVLIHGTVGDYVDPRGNIYSIDRRRGHKPYIYRKEMQSIYGYWYVPINYKTGSKKRRAHRIVAEAFIPNPNNYPIVMHKDNNKKNNHVDNLMWGTISMNTQQAFDDNLIKNASGYEDSQSWPCDMYSTATNKLLASFGSAGEAERKTGILGSTICRQMQNRDTPVRKAVYFTHQGEGPRNHTVIAQFDAASHQIINVFPNCKKASTETGICEKVIAYQCNLSRQPNWTKAPCYFRRVYLKGEEIIEIQSESRVGCA